MTVFHLSDYSDCKTEYKNADGDWQGPQGPQMDKVKSMKICF